MAKPLETLLYVDDEPDIRTVAELALRLVGGYAVTLASSGAEAVAVAPALAPDLVLLDVMMPGLDGPGTLAQLRQLPALAATPVVFVTAKVQPGEVARWREMGVVDVVPKPFDPMQLAAQVQAIWDRAHAPASPS